MKSRQGLDRALVRPSAGGRGNVWVLFQERLESLQRLESPGYDRGSPPPNPPCALDFPSISFRLREGWGRLPMPRARAAVRPALLLRDGPAHRWARGEGPWAKVPTLGLISFTDTRDSRRLTPRRFREKPAHY